VPWVETDGAHAPDQRPTLSRSRRTSHRKTPKVTLIAASSAFALAAVAAGTVAAWPGTSPAASARLAGAASFAGSQNAADSTVTGAAMATDTVAADSVHQLKVSEAAARQAALRQAIAHERARKAAQSRAAAAAAQSAARAAALAAARAAAARRQAPATPAAAAQPVNASGSPQQIAQGMLGSYGWSASQFSCLQPLWNAESGWNVSASNTSSGAYGIPQALPGSKMASAGADWQTDAATQIRWGLGYIQSLYGSPCAAWSHEEAYGWY